MTDEHQELVEKACEEMRELGLPDSPHDAAIEALDHAVARGLVEDVDLACEQYEQRAERWFAAHPTKTEPKGETWGLPR